MNESDLKRELIAQIVKRGFYARRVEDKYLVGFPDVVIMLPKYPVIFAEVKIVKGRKFGPTSRQLLELKKMEESRADVITAVIGYWNARLVFSRPAEEIDVASCFASNVGEFVVDAIKRWVNHVYSI